MTDKKNNNQEILIEQMIAGDIDARNKLIELYDSLIHKLVRKWHIPSEIISHEDAYNYAVESLCKSLSTFDPTKPAGFVTFFSLLVRYGVLHAYRQKYFIRPSLRPGLRKAFYHFDKVLMELHIDGITDQSLEKMAEHLGVTVEDMQEAALVKMPISSIDAPTGADSEDGGGSDHYDITPGEIPNYERDIDIKNASMKLRECLSELTEREQYIAGQRFLLNNPRTFRDLGDELGISYERVRQIESIIISKITKKMLNKSVKTFL